MDKDTEDDEVVEVLLKLDKTLYDELTIQAEQEGKDVSVYISLLIQSLSEQEPPEPK